MPVATDSVSARDANQKRVDAISPWHHSIDLGDGVVTKGNGKLSDLLAAADVYFGMGVDGLTVLDVGAWDGFNSFEAEKRGAKRVLAVDWYCWGGPGPGKREAFLTAHEILGSGVESRVRDIPETTVDSVGQFDVVLFNGIIYHILDPIHALINMAAIAKKALCVETWVDNQDNPRPVMNFFPGEVCPPGHPQNGWGPNSKLMHALLRHIGFETVLEFGTPSWEHQRSIFVSLKPGHGFDAYVRMNAERQNPRYIEPPAPIQTPSVAPRLMGWREIGTATKRRLALYLRK